MTGVLVAVGIALALVWILIRFLRRPASSSGWRLWCRRAGIGLAWAVAILLVLWAGADLWSRSLLEKEMEKAAQVGPLSFQQLLPPMPLADENGCSELMRASELQAARKQRAQAKDASLEDRWFWNGGLSRAFTKNVKGASYMPWNPKQIQDARSVLDRNGEILSLIRRGADRPHLRYPLDTNGRLFDVRLPHLTYFRDTSRLLLAAARVEAEEGRTDQALQDLSRSARIGRGLEEDPVVISCMVSLAIRGLTCDGVDWILKEGAKASPEEFGGLSEALRLDKDLGRLILLGERASGMDCMERLMGDLSQFRRLAPALELEETESGWPASLGAAVSTAPGRPWMRWQEAVHLHVLSDMSQHAEDPARELVDPEEIPTLAILPRLLIPALNNVRTSLLRTRARCDATRWALAVLQHKMKTGKLPATLEEVPAELIQDRPLDPWALKPFVYKPEADGSGFVLYSLGENRKDDGGNFTITQDNMGGSHVLDLGVRWKVR